VDGGRNRYDVVVLGGVNTDYAIRASSLPIPNRPASDGAFFRACGGKGLNQAVAAARLGARVALIARVGADARGREAVACLASEQVATDFVTFDPVLPTGVAVIHVDKEGRKQTAAALGANRQLSTADVDAAAPAIAHAGVLLAQLEIPLACVERAARIATSQAVRVILDPAPAAPLADELTRQLFVVKPNAGEARSITGVHVDNRDSARAAAQELRRRGARHVVVSLDDGTLLLSEDLERWYPNLPVQTIDTTGAGDAFAGVLAVASIEGRSIDMAVEFAHTAAAAATTVVGAFASLPTRGAVEHLLSRQD